MAASRLPAAHRSSIIASRGIASNASGYCDSLHTTGLHKPPALEGASTWRRRASMRSFILTSPLRHVEAREPSLLLTHGVRSPSWGGYLGGVYECVRSATPGACRSRSTGTKRGYVKPTRSVLYTPGSSRHLYKIRDIACDASLIDLEVGRSKLYRSNEGGGTTVAVELVRFDHP